MILKTEKKVLRKICGENTLESRDLGRVLRRSYLFTIIILGSTSIVFSQPISTEELNKRVEEFNKRITGDSITYSWDQANEFVNGLRNEVRLDSAYSKVIRENISLLDAYKSLEKRFLNYRDSIAPAQQDIIKADKETIRDLNNLIKGSEKSFKKQRRKKWEWGLISLFLGTILGIVLSMKI